MFEYRYYFIPFIPCFVVEAAIYFGLLALGMEEESILLVELIWMLCTIWICISVGERLERK
jgi:uncharacterized membrane protein YbhN (UPF0104 family)